MKINVVNRQKDLILSSKSVRPIVKELLKNESFKTDEISINFVSESEICNLHEEFFEDPSPTDCITFPIDGLDSSDDYHVLGEIFICPKAALDFNSDDVYKETTLYLVHGLLHLLGYDDINPKDRTKMRAAEKKHMQALEIKNLLLTAE